jgi:hypothetical protein
MGCNPFSGAQRETVLEVTAGLLDRFERGIKAVRKDFDKSLKDPVQFSAEAYCGATPIEEVPFLGSAVSPMTK